MVKFALIAGIMGALLIFGVFTRTTEPATVEPVPVPVAVEEPLPDVTILSQQTLEMLDPVYSEKSVFNDRTIRIAFNASFVEDGPESRLPFWIHNLSDDVINILWERCSIQLPSGNTVNVVSESSLDFFAPAERTISIAPAGDLFDAFIPVTEIVWEDDTQAVTTNVFDEGTFTLVLAIEKAAISRTECVQREILQQPASSGCETEVVMPREREMEICATRGREIVYYTFRFVLR